METLIINAKKSNVKLILELVEKLGGTGKVLTEKEKVEKSHSDPNKIDEILKDKRLTKNEKAFYKKFARAVDEARDIEVGNKKGIPLEKTLNEI